MNKFQEDDFHIWKIKLELAKEGNIQAIQEIKNTLKASLDSDHFLTTANYAQILKHSNIHFVKKGETFGSYELYSKVPLFFLLQGKAGLQCINTQGDNEVIYSTIKSGLLEISQTELKIKFGQNNISLLTQFQIIGQENSIIIEFPLNLEQKASLVNIQQITLREQSIMRKYMLTSLKHITKLTYTKGQKLQGKFYLLEGRACYFNKKQKYMLACYNQGFFNSVHFSSEPNTLYIFEGAHIMVFQEEMLKDEVAIGLQTKRKQHLQSIAQKYSKISQQQRRKMQQNLIQKYNLNQQEVQQQIYCIEKPVQKFMKSKNDFIRTSSSMKDKCGIRIRKSKKIN